MQFAVPSFFLSHPPLPSVYPSVSLSSVQSSVASAPVFLSVRALVRPPILLLFCLSPASDSPLPWPSVHQSVSPPVVLRARDAAPTRQPVGGRRQRDRGRSLRALPRPDADVRPPPCPSRPSVRPVRPSVRPSVRLSSLQPETQLLLANLLAAGGNATGAAHHYERCLAQTLTSGYPPVRPVRPSVSPSARPSVSPPVVLTARDAAPTRQPAGGRRQRDRGRSPLRALPRPDADVRPPPCPSRPSVRQSACRPYSQRRSSYSPTCWRPAAM